MKHPSKACKFKSAVAVATVTLLAVSGAAQAADSITEALSTGKTSLNMRLRYEGVQQNNALKDAAATTARLRLGYETADFNGFSAMVEAEAAKALGAQNFNSAANGNTGYSLVADPEYTEINQSYLAYSGLSGTTVKWGRQRIILDNARFVGNVGWRQNEQTFDALTIVNQSLPDTKITAGYITNVNRLFSDNAIATVGAAAGNHKMKSPVINVNYKGLSFGELSGYGYFLDYDLPAAHYGLSTKTIGLRLKGATPMGESKLSYTAEYASQSNYKNNPATFSTKYAFAELGLGNKLGELKAAYEVLGGNGVKSFSTPLATLHAFNGWADMFLTTPAAGLKDASVTAGSVLGGIKLAATYHDFSADSGSAKYGSEWDLLAAKRFDKNYLVGAKYGRFSSKNTAFVDTSKVWLWAEAMF